MSETKPEETTEDNKTKKQFIPNAELGNMSTEALIEEVIATRSEARERRLERKDLEGKLSEIEEKKKADAQTQLEKNQEWEKAYAKLKDETKDYTDLLGFKNNHLESCKAKVDTILPTLSEADKELFELSAKGHSYSTQLDIITKMSGRKAPQVSKVDTTQSISRVTGAVYTKAELLADTKLMMDVKVNNPDLYNKYFGGLT